MFKFIVNEKFAARSPSNPLFTSFQATDGSPMFVPEFFSVNDGIDEYLLESAKWKHCNAYEIETDLYQAFDLLQRHPIELPDDFEGLISYLWGKPVKIKHVIGMRMDPKGFLGTHTDRTYGGSMVFYLNPVWEDSWGGLLRYREDSKLEYGDIGPPLMGTMSFAKHVKERDDDSPLWQHDVSPVASDCPRSRMSIVIRWSPDEESV
jgi:hypothetical protein